MSVIDDVVKRFNRVKPDKGDSSMFTITRPNGVPIPLGEDEDAESNLFTPGVDFTLQGIQRRKDGSFVLTGGSSGTDGDSYNRYSSTYPGGYAYLTAVPASSDCTIATVVYPPYVESGCQVSPGVGDPMGPPIYLPNNHLGGCQVVETGREEEVLAVGYGRLNYEDDSHGTSTVFFYQLGPRPQIITRLTIDRWAAGNNAADAVGLTRSVALDGTPAGWLLVVANYQAQRLDFYTAPGTVFDDDPNSTDHFTPAGSWAASIRLYTTIKDTNWEAYRNVNLFTQSNGSLWLIGMHMSDQKNEDWADLYSLYNPDILGTAWGTWALGSSTPSPASGWSLTKMGKMHFTRKHDGPRFEYGAGYYYNDATQCFEVYDCEGHLSGSGRTQIRCSRWLGTP